MFEVGIITKPQGIRGELRVLPTTDDPSRFELLVGEEILLRIDGVEKPYKLQQARPHKGFVLVKLDGINDRNMAETLVRGTILIPDELALPLDEGQYYVRDLIGLAVQTENGEHIGTIGKILNTPANDVYVIDVAEGDSFMIPAIKQVVLDVSIPNGTMTIHLMDGLRELKA